MAVPEKPTRSYHYGMWNLEIEKGCAQKSQSQLTRLQNAIGLKELLSGWSRFKYSETSIFPRLDSYLQAKSTLR